MNWLNVRLANLRAPEYIGSDPTARATWWNVMAYCAEQENGGRIVGAKAWKCRQWQQTCGVMLDEVSAAAKLFSWDGDDLVVWNYPLEKEQEIRVKREAGNVGGKRSGEARAKQSLNGHRSSASRNASSLDSTEGEVEGKENSKEKGKKRAGAQDDFSSLPLALDTAAFKDEWKRFVEYRRRRKFAPLLPESIEALWRKMETWGVVAAITQMEETIGNAYQGVFAPKSFTANPLPRQPAPPRPAVPYQAKEEYL